MGTCESRSTKRNNVDVTSKDNNIHLHNKPNDSKHLYKNSNNNNSTNCVHSQKQSTSIKQQNTITSTTNTGNNDVNNEINVMNKETSIFNMNQHSQQHKRKMWMYYIKPQNTNTNVNTTKATQNYAYSNENEYDNILKDFKQYTTLNDNNNKHVNLSLRFLLLNEREWEKANMILFQNILSFRVDTNILLFEKFLKNRIKLNEHFNWMIWSIAIYYIHCNTNTNLFQEIKPPLPMNNSDEWSNGFEWKGLYIRVLTQYKRIKKLKREIKALNALFFEYIQLIENTKLNEVDNLLSNDFIFSLIGYCEYEDKVIMVSAVIHNYNDNDELSKYDSKLRYDLHNSPLFHNISKLHLYPLVDNLSAHVEKYIIINAYDLFPNLLGNTNEIQKLQSGNVS